ncbi:hypothetical protein LCGC14_1858630 [marine sediment metagenome]|uniref:Uncharacterized protein n=1 Tax=marine sediment metagenome TaxID=412755 RepID=A0A0F9IML2_9ZZZZ
MKRAGLLKSNGVNGIKYIKAKKIGWFHRHFLNY